MKNFCVRISKMFLPSVALLSIAFTSNAQTIRVNGTVCTATPLSVTVGTNGTDITVPQSCVVPISCTGVPTITSFSPATGAAGTTITVVASNLCSGTTVSINGTPATSVAISSNSLTAIVGAGTTTGKVSVTSNGATATSVTDFTVNANAVTIASVSPAAPKPGETFIITGANFIPGAILIKVGGIQANPSVSSTNTALSAIPPSLAACSTQTIEATTNGQVATLQVQLGSPSGSCGGGGSGDLSIEGDVIPTPSRASPGGKSAYRSGKLNGLPGSLNPNDPFQFNSYAAADVATKCANATPAITRLWQHNINFASYQASGGNDYPFLAPNEAMTWKFVAPAEMPIANIFQYNEGTQVFNASAYMSVSTKPCDFDVSKLAPGTRNICHASGAVTAEIRYRSTAGAVEPYECKLVPGQTYYLNLRMQDARPAAQGGSPSADSCAASGAGLCGGYTQIR